VTPYHCIDEITDCHPGPGNCPLIDCYGLGQDADGLIPGIGGTVEAICDGVVTAAGQAVTVALAGAWPINAELLDFNGYATISKTADISDCDAGSPGNCAGQLGNDNYDRDLHSNNGTTRANRDGDWDGNFFFKLLKKLPGSWEAKRPQ
jgi:hypothetical protein